MSEILKSLNELYGLDVPMVKWSYEKEEATHKTVELIGDELSTIGYICPWGGVWVATIMAEAEKDTGEHIVRLHNLLPEIIQRLELVESTIKNILDDKPTKPEVYMALERLIK